MPLSPQDAISAAQFLGSPLWAAIRREAMKDRPASAGFGDTPDVAAAKAQQRTGWEAAFTAIHSCYRVADPAAPTTANPLAKLGISDEALAKMLPMHQDHLDDIPA